MSWKLALAVLLASSAASAQQILLDEPLRVGSLVAFRALDDSAAWYYAPTRARLATRDGKPRFSFLRYVENVRKEGVENPIGEGGGIVHAVVELGASEAERADAQAELRRRVPGASLRGPVVFRSGRFGLVSSFQQENGELATRVVGLGSAPILEGSQAALSIQLTRLGAQILWQSFQTATPDISFLFEMEIAGFRAPRKAVIEAELDQIYTHRAFAAGAATLYTQAELTEAFDDLYRKGVIRVVEVGEDAELASLVQLAYSKLIALIFQAPTGPTPAAAGGARTLERASKLLDDRLTQARDEQRRQAEERRRLREQARRDALLLRQRADAATASPEAEFLEHIAAKAARLDASFQKQEAEPAAQAETQEQPELAAFAAVVSYELKSSRQRGLYWVSLEKHTADTLSLRFDENIGDLRRHLADPALFRAVNLDDPLYRQREVIASLTGVDARAFEGGLAFVALQLRKRHQNGEETLQDVRIDRRAFAERGNRFELGYGWKGDDDRAAWHRYDYRTLWSFGADAVEEPWRESSFNAIALTPPYRARSVQLDGLRGPLEEAGVRSVTVKVISVLAGREQRWQKTLRPLQGELSASIEFLQPREQLEYDYELEWRLSGNRSASSGRRRTDQDVLYFDELPPAAGGS